MRPQHLIRDLAEEARQRAAKVPVSAPEHDFYVGVVTAASDGLHPQNLEIHNHAWLHRQSVEFRDGYVKASTMIAGIRSETRHLVLPAPHGALST